MATLNTSFFIGSTSFLPATRTCIKAWISSNFGQIRPLITKSAALERLENRILMLCLHFCSVFGAGNKGNHKIVNECEIRPVQTTYCGVSSH